MSRKQLLLNLLALSCLANGGINASEVSEAPPQKNGSGVSATSTTKDSALAHAKVEGQNKSKDDFFHRYKAPILSGSTGALGGGVIGGALGYWLGGKDKVSNEELSKAKTEISELKQKINDLSNAQSKIDQLNSEIQALKNELNAERQKVTQKEQEIVSLNNKISEQETTINSLTQGNNQVADLTNRINNLTNEKNNLIADKNNLATQLSNQKDAIKAIVGEENANDLTAQKDKLTKLFKLGTCLDESMGVKYKENKSHDISVFKIPVNCKGFKKYCDALGTKIIRNMPSPNGVELAWSRDDLKLGIHRTYLVPDYVNEKKSFANPAHRLAAFLPISNEDFYKDKALSEAADGFCDFINWAIVLSNKLENKNLFPSDEQ